MATKFEMLQRRRDVRSMLETGMPTKRIAPYLMERYELSRSAAYRLIEEGSAALAEEMEQE